MQVNHSARPMHKADNAICQLGAESQGVPRRFASRDDRPLSAKLNDKHYKPIITLFVEKRAGR